MSEETFAEQQKQRYVKGEIDLETFERELERVGEAIDMPAAQTGALLASLRNATIERVSAERAAERAAAERAIAQATAQQVRAGRDPVAKGVTRWYPPSHEKPVGPLIYERGDGWWREIGPG